MENEGQKLFICRRVRDHSFGARGEKRPTGQKQAPPIPSRYRRGSETLTAIGKKKVSNRKKRSARTNSNQLQVTRCKGGLERLQGNLLRGKSKGRSAAKKGLTDQKREDFDFSCYGGGEVNLLGLLHSRCKAMEKREGEEDLPRKLREGKEGKKLAVKKRENRNYQLGTCVVPKKKEKKTPLITKGRREVGINKYVFTYIEEKTRTSNDNRKLLVWKRSKGIPGITAYAGAGGDRREGGDSQKGWTGFQ